MVPGYVSEQRYGLELGTNRSRSLGLRPPVGSPSFYTLLLFVGVPD